MRPSLEEDRARLIPRLPAGANRHFRWLKLLRDRLGYRYRARVTIYTGTRSLPLGRPPAALPLAALWTA